MHKNTNKPNLLTTDEAADFLGVHPGTLAVWRCVSRYRLPFLRVGRKVFYEETDLLKWMQSRKVQQSELTAQ